MFFGRNVEAAGPSFLERECDGRFLEASTMPSAGDPAPYRRTQRAPPELFPLDCREISPVGELKTALPRRGTAMALRR